MQILKSAPVPANDPDLVIQTLTLEGEADIETHNFSAVEVSLNRAAQLCTTSESVTCGYVLKAQGLLADERRQPESAEQLYKLTLNFARAHRDDFLEAHALLDLGNVSLSRAQYDEAIDRSEAAYQAAKVAGARRLELMAETNVGWAYFKLGDSENALGLFEGSEKLASQLGDIWSDSNELTNIGYCYMDQGKPDEAAQVFQQALALAQKINAKDRVYNALRVLARLSLQTGDLVNASQYAQHALDIARQDNNHSDELYPTLVLGQIAARTGDTAKAEIMFRGVERDKDSPAFLKWESEHSLAKIYEARNALDAADREYRQALATFEGARPSLRRNDAKLAFSNNGFAIYEDYIHFLVANRRSDDALRWADNSRARTLAEGLGYLTKTLSNTPPQLNPQAIARRANGIVLFYWLGGAESYLWAITPRNTNLFTLPRRAEIDKAVQRYRAALAGPQDALESSDPEGRWLYENLVVPAHLLIPKDARVFVIPDGSLSNLNFETLLVSSPQSTPNSQPNTHYWIEDATLDYASSLWLLERRANNGARKSNMNRSLLLFGDSVASNNKYSALPKAAEQMAKVAGHFPSSSRRIFSRVQANPAAYLDGHPEQFSYIHFVAHGTATRLSPLDSAIILSKAAAEDDSFKLYARDIIRVPLRAELVIISACYGAGDRVYRGEGLIGLSWAFIKAGAHNVIAASWEVTDAPTPEFMDNLYRELDRGAPPDVALRTAKLALLHSRTAFHKPFYWAPFQLYAGS